MTSIIPHHYQWYRCSLFENYLLILPGLSLQLLQNWPSFDRNKIILILFAFITGAPRAPSFRPKINFKIIFYLVIKTTPFTLLKLESTLTVHSYFVFNLCFKYWHCKSLFVFILFKFVVVSYKPCTHYDRFFSSRWYEYTVRSR